MNGSDQNEPLDPAIGHEAMGGHPFAQPNNRAIGFLRFFVALTPTALLIGCFPLSSWFRLNVPEFSFAGEVSLLLAFAGLILCGWFDSQLDLRCRLGTRHPGRHITEFVFRQILIIPAVIIAIVTAICGVSML